MLGEKLRILVAEDEKIIAIDIRNTLRGLGYEVIAIVNTGEEAIKAAGELKPDMILMDIMLSGTMTGIDAAKVILPQYDIPVIYLTALSDNETLNRAKVTEPFGYVLKPYDARVLNSAIEMAVYKHKIDSELRRKTKELEEEKIRTDRLLHNILPSEIVDEWKTYGFISPRHYNHISILFTDFHGFTDISSRLSPDLLVEELNDIFQNFDTIIESYNLEKLKTIGDTYMIGAGLPKESDDHAVRITKAALDMQDYIIGRNKSTKVQWHMRAGINSGQVIAGIVGTNKFTYDVWGDTVNIASRMESSSLPGKINISGSTYALIKEYFDCEYRGKLNAKGKGEIDMYFVNQLKSGRYN
jgi:adenylate cyclase